jgi:predicted dehydrogenase
MRTPIAVGAVLNDGRPELTRALDELAHVQLRWICDAGAPDPGVGHGLSAATLTTDYRRLLDDEELDAVVLDAQLRNCGEWIRDALEADKHVLVRGPLALTAREAEELVSLAESRRRRLRVYVEHVARPSFRRLRATIDRGGLGDVLYVRASRSGVAGDGADLRTVAADTVAVVLELLRDEPIEIAARTETYTSSTGADLAFVDLRFATGITAHIHASTLDATPLDHVAVVGSRLTATLDFAAPAQELVLCACGSATVVDESPLAPGDVLVPRLPEASPSRTAAEEFVALVRTAPEIGLARETVAVAAVLDALGRPTVAPAADRDDAERRGDGHENVIELRAL